MGERRMVMRGLSMAGPQQGRDSVAGIIPGLLVRRSVPLPLGCNMRASSVSMRASGAWQKYSYRRRDGIIGAKNSSVLLQGYSYDHHRFAVPRRIPQGAADRTTTGLLGAECAPSDPSPASGATRQDSFGAGDGSQPVPCDAPVAPQSRDGTGVAPAVARPRLQAGAD